MNKSNVRSAAPEDSRPTNESSSEGGGGPQSRRPRVAVIGAGFGGIAMAAHLQKLGIGYTVFERSDSIGGTWLDNEYPGAEVDNESHIYSYSFAHHDWTRSHARRAELLKYLQDVARTHASLERFRLGTTVDRVQWLDRMGAYELTLKGGERELFDVVVSAVGLFSSPRSPEWPGVETFQGQICHSARWKDIPDLAEKRVAVVGTGSSAASLIPAIAPEVRQLYVFQREPGWVLPKNDRIFAEHQRRRFRNPLRYRLRRWQLLWQTPRHVRSQYPGTRGHRRVQQEALDFINRTFADRPDLRRDFTPDYPIFGKRVVRSDVFYGTFLRDNVSLIPRAVATLKPGAVVDATGQEHAVDAVVAATGFHASQFLLTLEVVGRGGVKLQDEWGTDPSAFVGTFVPRFPNFFMLMGPNTFGGGAGVAFTLECQARLIARLVREMGRSDRTEVEVRRSANDWYNRLIQWRLRGGPWVDTNNYYKSPSGRVVLFFPFSSITFWLFTRLPTRMWARWRRS